AAVEEFAPLALPVASLPHCFIPVLRFTRNEARYGICLRSMRGSTMLVSASHRVTVEGHVSPGFEGVRDVFAENFARRGEAGGACCAYLHGEKVVDLWGGVRNKRTGEPWSPDTMVLVNSTTKGLAAMTMALAHSRGWLDYEAPISKYWPEFAQQGKAA